MHSRTALPVAVMCGLFVVPAQADADKGTAAVTDHHRDGQRHHRQRKHHRIGGVAVGAEIVCVGNKNLIHDVVKCCHQQRDDTGDGVLCHQLSEPFCFKKGIRFLFHRLFPPLNMRKRPARRAGLMPSGRALSGIDFWYK